MTDEKTDPNIKRTPVTIQLPIEGDFLERILKLQERRRGGQNIKTLGPEIAYEALNIGLNALESTLDELEDGTLAKVFDDEARA